MEKLKYGYTLSEYKKFNSHAWRYLFLFSLLYCTHYCTRLNIGNAQILMPYTESEIGIITSVLFWTYGIGHLINGRLGEIFGIRRFIMASVILSVLANVVMGFQTTLLGLAIVWGFNGFFQSMAWSPGISSLTAWWPSNKRGFATGFANAFSGFGEVVAKLMVVLGFLLFSNNWRSAFFVPAALPLLMLVIYAIFAKASPKSIGLKDYKEQDREKAEHEIEMAAIVKEKGKLYPYLHLLKNKVFLVWVFVVFASGLARYGLATWIPKYLDTQAGLGATTSILTSAVLPIGMGIGTFIIPTLTDKFCPNNRLLAGVVSGFAAAACVVGFMLLKPEGAQLVLMFVLLFFAGFFIYAINGVVWTFAADVGGRVFASTAAGVLDFAAYMGAAIQSLMFGFILEKGDWSVLFISVAVFCFAIAVVSLISAQNKRKKM